MTPTITVVIPNRNDSLTLVKCIDSVVNQDIGPDQIVIVDDQSTDNSQEVIQKTISDIPQAEMVINPVQLGTMGALNRGLECATSDYVLFLSSNDYLEKGIFQRAKQCIATHGFPGVWSAMVWAVDENGGNPRLYPSPVVALSDAYFSPNKCTRFARSIGHWFTGTTLIYDRKTLHGIGGFDTNYHGFADMFAALTVASINGASFSPEPFGVMRMHAGGLMHRTLIDLPLVDAITKRISDIGPQLSPKLFTPQFCELIQRRIHFTVIRAFKDNSWKPHLRFWKGFRYRLLSAISRYLDNYRAAQLVMAFVLIRPIRDIFYLAWYRAFGTAIIKAKMRK
jgi:glycosyltransferase involved in cell wall biosynthesis